MQRLRKRRIRERRRTALSVLEWLADVVAGNTEKKLRWNYFYPQFKKLADENPKDFVGCDSLSWIVDKGKVDSPEFAQALALLSRHHAKATWADYICLNAPRYFAAGSDGIEGLLREIMRTNPEAMSRAEACFCLSQFLSNKAEFALCCGGRRLPISLAELRTAGARIT